MIKKIMLGLTVVAFAGAGVAIAQQSGIKRTPLQKLDFPAGYNTVTAIAEVPAGGAAGRHTHPAPKPVTCSRVRLSWSLTANNTNGTKQTCSDVGRFAGSLSLAFDAIGMSDRWAD